MRFTPEQGLTVYKLLSNKRRIHGNFIFAVVKCGSSVKLIISFSR